MKVLPKERPLTRREVEIVNLIAQGRSNREIAEALGIAYQTAKNHASSIYYKFGVRSRTEAAVKVWWRGLPKARPGATGMTITYLLYVGEWRVEWEGYRSVQHDLATAIARVIDRVLSNPV
jgi:DNA-binding CsgD family transcriptional regulator